MKPGAMSMVEAGAGGEIDESSIYSPATTKQQQILKRKYLLCLAILLLDFRSPFWMMAKLFTTPE
jgi:hypothetical protein